MCACSNTDLLLQWGNHSLGSLLWAVLLIWFYYQLKEHFFSSIFIGVIESIVVIFNQDVLLLNKPNKRKIYMPDKPQDSLDFNSFYGQALDKSGSLWMVLNLYLGCMVQVK